MSSFHQRAALPSPYGGYLEGMNGGGEDGEEDSAAARGGGGEGSSSAAVQREHMFDKVVTPSDVGKLNRLVIPKQHAEKYFPLDSSANEKGLLLNFEDRNGKPWRFRYSYWNSSQSYVMTKGWSRFVKEKKLDAGDIVSFQRGVGEAAKDRLFIDWRRRPDAPDLTAPPSIPHHFAFHHHRSSSSSLHHPWSPLFMPPPPTRGGGDYSHLLHPNAITTHHHYHHHPHPPSGYGPYAYGNVVNGNPCPPGSIVYLRGGAAASAASAFASQPIPTTQRGGGGAMEQMVFESVPVVQGKAAAKRLRLFGVNMDCPISDSDETAAAAPPQLTLHGSPSSFQLSPSYEKGKGSMSLDLDI